MFVRQKKNKSGLVSVQVIDKSRGKYRVVKTIGSSCDEQQVNDLRLKGEAWIRESSGTSEFDFEQADKLFEQFLAGISSIRIIGPSLLLGGIFDAIGFNAISDELFRKLVLARLCYPVSKLKTTEYLRRYEGYLTSEDQIYRYLDRLNKTQKRQIQCISYKHTLQVLNQQISVVFYDVTTLYFEIRHEDELRKPGFSKEGRHQNPQILLGLLVSVGGYPLAYDIFQGSKFEGHTMMPVLNLFRRKYKLSGLAVVADAGLLSGSNIEALRLNGYQYIIGARLKNESADIKTAILNLRLKDGQSTELLRSDGSRLIINYAVARALNDNDNRQRAIRRLEKLLKTGKLTKSQINNKGYNRLLKMEGEISVLLDPEKIAMDSKWDGLKGYITNTTLTMHEIITNYGHLWQIEKAFRIAKTDLSVRPIYHRIQRRIEAHICIAFTAYKVYKELERLLKEKKSSLSPERAIEIAKTIYCINATKPKSRQPVAKIIITSDEQRYLANLFGF
ncbi:MAG TPA: IS1634 family transposase [Puia sp.]|nr:IS1634 family transposase [Puia sp.]